MPHSIERCAALLTVIAALSASEPAYAQRAPAWSFGVGAGAGGSFTGTSVKDGPWAAMPAVDLTLMFRPRPSHNAFVFGLNATGIWIYPSNDMCVIAPDGGCLPGHALFSFGGVLAGWESRGSRLRVVGGPAFAVADGPHPALGLQARVEGALPIVRHLSFAGSLRGGLVPNYEGATYSLVGAGIGLRLHGR